MKKLDKDIRYEFTFEERKALRDATDIIHFLSLDMNRDDKLIINESKYATFVRQFDKDQVIELFAMLNQLKDAYELSIKMIEPVIKEGKK